MNFKSLTFQTIAFFFISTTALVYTDDTKKDNISSKSAITAEQQEQLFNDPEFQKQIHQFIEETFQTVTEHTQKIEYCLQQVEIIINSGKMKFNEQVISKTQLLQQIKYIKEYIQFLTEIYTKELPKESGIIQGTFFNHALIEYLLPIVSTDITKLNIENLEIHVDQKVQAFIEDPKNVENLTDIIETNQKNLKLLIEAADNIGLTTLNKIYHFLDTKPLPWYGKSTFATIKDVAFWSAAALAAYSIAAYMIPSDCEIPYLGFNSNKLWGKDKNSWFYLGSVNISDTYNCKSTSHEDKVKLLNNPGLGYLGQADTALQALDNKFVVLAGGYLLTQTKGNLQDIYTNSLKSLTNAFNYYLKGDASALKKNNNNFAKAYFKDMIGGQHLEELAHYLADYLKNPLRYERQGVPPATGYLLVGPSQTGKSFFAKALKTLIDEEFAESNEKINFWNITSWEVERYGFDLIFHIARRDAPCILFIDEIDMYGTRRDKNANNTQQLLTSLNGLETDLSKKVIVIAATNKPEELDFALKQKGRLGNIITFDVPTYECRKQYLEKQLMKKNIKLHPDMIESIAQETDGHTYNMIDDIIRHSLQLATFQTRPVEEADFETTLDHEVRKIKPNVSMSAQEQELVAIYQAGQAVARHTLKTDQQIVKITIDTVDKPIKSKEGFSFGTEEKGQKHENFDLLPQNRIKPTRLGFVFTMSKTNNHELLNDEEQEAELIALLSGFAALELIKGKTYNEFGKEDRAKVLDTLEKKISQGTPITDDIRKQAIAQKEILYNKAKNTLSSQVQFIKIITDELIKNHTINKKQWADLIEKYLVA